MEYVKDFAVAFVAFSLAAWSFFAFMALLFAFAAWDITIVQVVFEWFFIRMCLVFGTIIASMYTYDQWTVK